jgi:hypothetical protein
LTPDTWIAILSTATTLMSVYSGIVTFMLLRYPSRREFRAHETLDNDHMSEIRLAIQGVVAELRELRALREKDLGRQ